MARLSKNYFNQSNKSFIESSYAAPAKLAALADPGLSIEWLLSTVHLKQYLDKAKLAELSQG